MKRPGGHVKVNFGQAQFYYDIDEFVRVCPGSDLIQGRQLTGENTA